MKQEYFSVTFQMGMHDNEIWMAMLSEWPFESFHEEEDIIIGYIQDHDITPSMMAFIESEQGKSFDIYELSRVPDQNWNEVWESSFNPVAVDDYCYIRAEFHKGIDTHFRHIITISPKMAFGTGHHATTYMMLQAMSDIDFREKQVLDFGCGTGILGIVAAKEGADHVTGVDIQTEAIENSEEHAISNGVGEKCSFYLGGLEKAAGQKYDIILANISRNVILESLPSLSDLLLENGQLLISGIMFDDGQIISDSLTKNRFTIISKKEKEQWVQLTVKN